MARLVAMSEKLALLDRDYGHSPDGTRAAVAVVLREVPGAESADLFFIVRATHPDDPWSGHVAFPGGRLDPEDASLLATAIRETREEVGIELSPTDLLARLPDLPAFGRSSKSRGLVVTPFVFALRRDPDVVPNEEVATTLWVPLAALAEGVGKTTFTLDHGGEMYDLPCIHLEPGQHRLWGMTYRMLETLLDAIR